MPVLMASILLSTIGNSRDMSNFDAPWPLVMIVETNLNCQSSRIIAFTSTYRAKTAGVQRNASAAIKTSCGYWIAASRNVKSSAIGSLARASISLQDMPTEFSAIEGVDVAFANNILSQVENA